MTLITTRRNPAPAYINDKGIVPADPGYRITFDVPAWLSPAPVSSLPQHGHNPAPIAISDGARMQRIVGLPYSWVEPAPRPREEHTQLSGYNSGPLLLDSELVPDTYVKQLRIRMRPFLVSALETWIAKQPRPYTRKAQDQVNRLASAAAEYTIDADEDASFTAKRERAESVLTWDAHDHAFQMVGTQKADADTYDGFTERDAYFDTHTNPHSRTELPLRYGADQSIDDFTTAWLATMDEAPVPEAEPNPGAIIDPWSVARLTRKVGYKKCARCSDGCNYCNHNGGWPITETSITASILMDGNAWYEDAQLITHKLPRSPYQLKPSPAHPTGYLGKARQRMLVRGAKGVWSARHRRDIRLARIANRQSFELIAA